MTELARSFSWLSASGNPPHQEIGGERQRNRSANENCTDKKLEKHERLQPDGLFGCQSRALDAQPQRNLCNRWYPQGSNLRGFGENATGG
jgi:hypothetical protein